MAHRITNGSRALSLNWRWWVNLFLLWTVVTNSCQKKISSFRAHTDTDPNYADVCHRKHRYEEISSAVVLAFVAHPTYPYRRGISMKSVQSDFLGSSTCIGICVGLEFVQKYRSQEF